MQTKQVPTLFVQPDLDEPRITAEGVFVPPQFETLAREQLVREVFGGSSVLRYAAELLRAWKEYVRVRDGS